jgi:predicted glycosyltransferase
LIILLEEEGNEVLVTARRYRETVELLEMEGIQYSLAGEYGGRRLEGKLEASLNRALELTKLVSDLHPDIVISHASPEAARVAFGLGIPHICINDSPHAKAVARLTVPLSQRLLTPKVIPKKCWTEYGISSDAIVRYNALDPVAWLRDAHPDRTALDKLGLSGDKPIIVLRTEEAYASYLSGHSPPNGSIVVSVVRELFSNIDDEIDLVILPRYGSQISEVKRSVPDKVKVAEHVIDSLSLLSMSSVFVGAGGTMTAEAALLGVPSISCYPGETTCIESFLIKKGLVRKISDPVEISREIIEILKNLASIRVSQAERANSILLGMEDPVEIIFRSTLEWLGRDR